MDCMGSKTRARQAMEAQAFRLFRARRADSSPPRQKPSSCRSIGYPVMLKAAAGGGGKGMRMVRSPDRTEVGVRGSAQRGRTFVRRQRSLHRESTSINPRHIEMQVLADEHGNTRLPGRARVLPAAASSEGAGRVAFADRRSGYAPAHGRNCGSRRSAAGYNNAGTVEFLVDQRTQLLFPGDEHAPAGGASGDRIGHRSRPRPSADSHRRRGAAAVQAG